VLALAYAALGGGCRERREGEDASAILQAYEAFQGAVPSDRRAALDALANARCRDPIACADRDACASYGAALVRANELTGKARAFGPSDAGGNGAATLDELAIIVGGAEDAVNDAERAEPACSAALQRLADRRTKAR
jgi:hypothetical protein